MGANLPPMTWWQYVKKLTGDASQTDVAKRLDLSPATVSRWSSGTQGVDPRPAAALARAYGRPIVEAFVYAGYLTAEEADATITLEAPGNLTDDELIEQLAVRLRNARVHGRADIAVMRDGQVDIFESKANPGGSFSAQTAFAPLATDERERRVFISGLAEDIDKIKAEFEKHLLGAVTRKGMSGESRAAIVAEMTADTFDRIRSLADAGSVPEQSDSSANAV